MGIFPKGTLFIYVTQKELVGGFSARQRYVKKKKVRQKMCLNYTFNLLLGKMYEKSSKATRFVIENQLLLHSCAFYINKHVN